VKKRFQCGGGGVWFWCRAPGKGEERRWVLLGKKKKKGQRHTEIKGIITEKEGKKKEQTLRERKGKKKREGKSGG